MPITLRYPGPISLKDEFPGFTNCWHLVDYFKGAPDLVSKSIIKYKQADPLIAPKWNKTAVKHFLRLDFRPDIVLRNLAHRENISTTGTPLDLLCQQIAAASDIDYRPFLLLKKRQTRPLHNLTRSDRIAELHNNYLFSAPDKSSATPNILIVDDIITTGTSMLAIHDAIKLKLPEASLFFFTLARTIARERRQ